MKKNYGKSKISLLTLKPSTKIRVLLIVLFICLLGNNMIAQNGPNCLSGVCIGPGGPYTGLPISSNVFYSNMTIKNNETLIVRSPFTLYVGQVGTPATTQVVDFQNGCTVVIESGASLVINGLLNNSNNSNGVTFNGLVAVIGNVSAGAGSTVSGAGTLDTTGSIITDGTGSVFGSNGDCGSCPCSGSTLICPNATNTISGNQTICSGNTPVALIGSNIDVGATYQWQQSTTFGANFVNIADKTQSSYTPGTLSTTTYYRRKETLSGCVGTSSQVTVVVVAAPIPTGSSNQAFCLGATVADLAATGTAIKWYDTLTGGTALTITSALVDGKKYYATQTISGCESVSRFLVTVGVNSSSKPATKTWNGTGWSPPGAPTGDQNIEFTGNYNVAADVIACSCTVTSGTVTISAGNNLILGDKLTVNAPGTLSFENNASLLQSGYTGTNNPSNINVKKNSTPIINDDFTYWSSPTSGNQTLLNFSPNTQFDKFFIFNNDWANVDAATTIFAPGIGYAIRSPEGISATIPAAIPFQFTGVPNNGVIVVPVTAITDAFGPAGLRLIGNPYPSALDADAFIDANITTGTGTKTISGTLYFWTHNHTLIGNNYSATDYATYTKLGGTGTVGVLTGIGNKNVPTKFIASGQGFFVEVDAPGTVTFNNAMRSAVNNANTNFYKIASKKTESLQSHRVWLNLTNNSENFSQALVGYAAEATNLYDPGYDGTSFGGETYGLYSLLGNDELTIQARALPFVITDIVPLGYTINAAGNAVITIDHVDGIFLYDQKVYLEDKLLNVIHDVKSSPYNFSSAAGTFNDRFVLRYTGKTLGTKDFNLNENTVLVAKDRNELKIKSQQENIKQITVFDLLGRKVFDKEAIDTNEFRTSNITVKKQMVVVKVTLSNGQVISKKVIF